LFTNRSGYNNTAVGVNAGYQSNRNKNTFIGTSAGFDNSYLQVTDQALGVENTYVGHESGYYANTGSYNVAVGHSALVGQGFFSGDVPGNIYYKRNVAIGDSSMAYAYGSDNVAVGYKALSKSTNTSQHVAIGSQALYQTTATYPNTAVGY